MAVILEGGQTQKITSAANANADIILPATPNVNYTIKQILISYSALPTSGRVGLLSGATIVFDHDIAQAGLIQLPFDMTEELVNTAMTIRLFAGGTGVIGKLTVAYIVNNIIP